MKLRDKIALDVVLVSLRSYISQPVTQAKLDEVVNSVPWTAYDFADNMLAARRGVPKPPFCKEGD